MIFALHKIMNTISAIGLLISLVIVVYGLYGKIKYTHTFSDAVKGLSLGKTAISFATVLTLLSFVFSIILSPVVHQLVGFNHILFKPDGTYYYYVDIYECGADDFKLYHAPARVRKEDGNIYIERVELPNGFVIAEEWPVPMEIEDCDPSSLSDDIGLTYMTDRYDNEWECTLTSSGVNFSDGDIGTSAITPFNVILLILEIIISAISSIALLKHKND